MPAQENGMTKKVIVALGCLALLASFAIVANADQITIGPSIKGNNVIITDPKGTGPTTIGFTNNNKAECHAARHGQLPRYDAVLRAVYVHLRFAHSRS